MENLLPCPFCGGEAVEEGTYRYARFIMCSVCEARTADYLEWDNAFKAWNKRGGKEQ